ncbi:putative MFS multidrug transporter [Biscogniauxia marginata]|nr:putative MFS multidrug transporter [Biscogniauxia marginata]
MPEQGPRLGEKYDSPKLSSSTEDDAEPKEGDESGDYIEGLKLAAVLISTTIVFFLLLLDNSIISTPPGDSTPYADGILPYSAALQPLTGKLYTHLPSKWTFLGFFFLFEVGSLLCGVATSSTMFILGRAVAGIGGSGLQNGALSVIAGAVPLEKRPVGQLGLVVGPLIGGALTEYTTWRWCFYINLPAGAVAAVLIVFTHVPEQIIKPKASWALMRRLLPQLDLPGFALFAPAAIMLLLALQYGSEGMPWGSATIIGLLCGAVATGIVFLIWESRIGDRAMIPFSMIKKRVVWTSNIQFSCLMTTVFVGSQYMPIYFQSVKGATATLSGVYMLPSILSQLALIILSGVLITRLGYYLPWALFAGAGTAVAAGLISTWSPYTETARWIGYQILYGARGCGVQPSVIAIQHALPPSQSAIGIAFLVFCQNFLAAVFVVVANTIFTETLSQAIVELAPSVDPAAAMAAGGSAEAVRNLVPPGSPELDGVLRAFARSFDTVCYVMVAAAAVSFIASWGMGWVDVRKKKQPANGDA